MFEFLIHEQDKEKNEMFRFIAFTICIFLIFISLYISGSAHIKKGELADSDCYMRLVRVSELYHSGKWYDPVVVRANAPYGLHLHWTRPFDVLLLAGAVPLNLFTDFKTALFWWGVIISPVLLIFTIIVFQWSVKPILLSKDGQFLACFVLVSQSTVLHYYQAGQSDHHSLIIFLFILSIGFALKMILKPFSAVLCYAAGVVGAFSIWVSVESMLVISIIIAILGLFWVLENGDFLSISLHFSIALYISVGLALVLERAWVNLFAEEYDSLSVVHFSVFGFIAILWTILFFLNRHTRFFRRKANRFSTILVGAAMLTLTILIFFPKFFKGPFADIDPRIIPIMLYKISELQPLISKSGPFTITVQLIISIIICFPIVCFLVLKDKCNNNWKGWIYISISFIFFLFISLYQIRWSVYPQILLTIPMAQLMVFLRQRGRKTGFLKALKNILILILFCATPLFLGSLTDQIIKKGDSSGSHQQVFLVHICQYLSEDDEFSERNCRILTHVDFGAEILYRTRHEVINPPYHRNSQGILDTYDIMTANTDAEALKLIQKRGIDLILLCPESTESAFYSKPGQTSTFYQRLLENIIPNWLRKVELPSDLSSSFLLFETIE